MSRPLRVQYPGAWYHVMNRGAGKQQIFRDARDYTAFLTLLGETSLMWKSEVHAYCLMPNHYHLLIRTPLANLSRVMRHINGVYTQRYNRRWNRDASLFRGRFKAILVEEDAYLDELVRYIHLNPAKANLTSKAHHYIWLSFPYYLGRSKKPQCLVTDIILQRFGQRQNKARRELVQFIAAGIPETLRATLDGTRWPSILSKDSYQEWITQNYLSPRSDSEVVVRLQEPRILSILQIRKVVCTLSQLSWRTMKRGKGSDARFWRKTFILALRQELGLSYKKMRHIVGHIHPSQVSRLINIDRFKIEKDGRWKRLDCELKSEKSRLDPFGPS